MQIIFAVVDEVNTRLPQERRLEKSVETALFGKQGKLDSIGLVHFIVEVEERVREDLGVSITIADEHGMSVETSPFRSISSLAKYITHLVATEV